MNDDGGKTNPLCGEPKNMNNMAKHTFRCALYGRFVTVKKTNIPVQYHLVFLEVMVNEEPSGKLTRLGREGGAGRGDFNQWRG